jgi:hypothetical protein
MTRDQGKFKFQIPSTKFQISTNLQSPNDPNREKKHYHLCFGHWDLEFVCDLVLDVWNFILPSPILSA